MTAEIENLKKLLQSSDTAHILLGFELLPAYPQASGLTSTLLFLSYFHESDTIQNKARIFLNRYTKQAFSQESLYSTLDPKQVFRIFKRLFKSPEINKVELLKMFLIHNPYRKVKTTLLFCLEHKIDWQAVAQGITLPNLTLVHKREVQLLSKHWEVLQNLGVTLLTASDLNLSALPQQIGNLGSLQGLVVSRNVLNKLPTSIGQLTQLKALYLSYNKLKKLPENVLQLPHLEKLHLSNNQFQTLPNSLGKITKLQVLDVSNNQLKQLPDTFCQLTNLQVLDLSNNPLRQLPQGFEKLQKLRKLKIGGDIESMAQQIAQLTWMEELTIQNTAWAQLPIWIGNFAHLQQLIIKRNCIKHLPQTLTKLHKLKNLDASYNHLQALPDDIGQLTALQEVSFEGNQLNKLPESMAHLQKLRFLQLGYNKLQSLPVGIGQLPTLETLILENNQLKTLAVGAGDFARLHTLMLTGNPITPQEIERLKLLLPHTIIHW